jgi:hypothetical protein
MSWFIMMMMMMIMMMIIMYHAHNTEYHAAYDLVPSIKKVADRIVGPAPPLPAVKNEKRTLSTCSTPPGIL